MGDMTEDYRAMDAHSKSKKDDNLIKSTKILDDNAIDYESKNNGIHLIVTSFNGTLIDFWPSTGKWTVRSGSTSRGVQNLIRWIESEISY